MAKANPEGMKWPTNKKQYDINYLRLFGKKCPSCGGTKEVQVPNRYGWELKPCWRCKGLGKVEK